MQASLLEDDGAARWDAFVTASPMGTFQHTRRFLSYHGDRFADQSVVTASAGKLRAVMPAAISPTDESCVISHPGATYGGLVLDRRIAADDADELLSAVCDALGDRGFSRLVYKAVPPHLHERASQADIHAIWRRGGRLVRRDLWNTIDLDREPTATPRRRRAVRKAEKRGIEIEEDNSEQAYASFLEMLTDRLRDRYATKPVHTLEEMRILRERFPRQISLWTARDRAGADVAGAWLFDLRPAAVHVQYCVANEGGRQDSALDLLLSKMIERARVGGTRYFSLGASTEGNGMVLNAGLFDYKSGFGAGSIAHDFYEIDLG